MERDDAMSNEFLEGVMREDVKRTYTSDDSHQSSYAFNNINNNNMMNSVSAHSSHMERIKIREAHAASDRRCRSLETSHDSRGNPIVQYHSRVIK